MHPAPPSRDALRLHAAKGVGATDDSAALGRQSLFNLRQILASIRGVRAVCGLGSLLPVQLSLPVDIIMSFSFCPSERSSYVERTRCECSSIG